MKYIFLSFALISGVAFAQNTVQTNLLNNRNVPTNISNINVQSRGQFNNVAVQTRGGRDGNTVQMRGGRGGNKISNLNDNNINTQSQRFSNVMGNSFQATNPAVQTRGGSSRNRGNSSTRNNTNRNRQQSNPVQQRINEPVQLNGNRGGNTIQLMNLNNDNVNEIQQIVNTPNDDMNLSNYIPAQEQTKQTDENSQKEVAQRGGRGLNLNLDLSLNTTPAPKENKVKEERVKEEKVREEKPAREPKTKGGTGISIDFSAISLPKLSKKSTTSVKKKRIGRKQFKRGKRKSNRNFKQWWYRIMNRRRRSFLNTGCFVF